MKTHRVLRAILLMVSCAALTASAQVWRSFFGGSSASSKANLPVYVRLVQALESGDAAPAPDPAIADVLPTLKRALRFRAYRVIAVKHTRIRNGRVVDLSLVRLHFSEIQGDSFRLEVEQNGRPVLRSRVRLRPGRPVVVGGLPSDNGALLLIFVHDKPSK